VTTLVDTNVLLDLVGADPVWSEWSEQQLEAAALRGPLLINPVVYAELSVRFARIEELDAVIEDGGFVLEEIPKPALFLAAKAFVRYRGAGGTRTGVLPDFFIGAHAAVAGLPLLTRDAGRFAGYFPTVRLISPEFR
jgi:predicted nucleic acid-binding protein